MPLLESSTFADVTTPFIEANATSHKGMPVCESPRKSFCKNAIRITHPPLSTIFSKILCACLLFGTLWGLLGPLVLPGGHIFALVVLVAASYVGGQLIEIIKLPPLLGMLIMGFVLQNTPTIDVAKDLDSSWSAALRSMSLGIILLRAGLCLDPAVLKRLSIACVRLSLTPCLVESTAIAVASHYIMGFPWLWGFILGFVVEAVSPAVVVPSMLILEEQGLGVDKGIPTLITAAASVDNVLAITGFGIVLSITFAKGGLAWTIAKGPVEIIIGLTYGCVLGIICWFFPNKQEEYAVPLRLFILIIGGLFGMFVSEAFGLKSVGPLGCLTVSFVAALKWRKEEQNVLKGSICPILNGVWEVFQPILFGLIGAEIKLSNLDGNTVGLGLATVSIGIVFRIITTFLVVFGTGFSVKEQLFVALAWLPKATVQAAIGPIALDYARTTDTGEKIEPLGIQVLTLAVLSILVTAPLGAAIISLSAPKLLIKTEKDSSNENATSEAVANLDIIEEKSLSRL